MIALKNCTLVHMDPPEVREGVDVLVDEDRIAEVGAVNRKAERTIDLDGRILMPGLVCAHNHFYSGLARGILARIEPSTDFVSVLRNLWWRLDMAIDEEILRASGMICAAEAIKAGCTSVIDHHASPSFIEGSLDVLAECFEKAGLRGILCYETTDRNGLDGMREGVSENRRFAKRARERGGIVEASIGGHAPFTLPDEALEELGDLVRDSQRGFHVHVAEDSFEQSFSHRMYGKDALARLDAFGLLTDKSIIAHGLDLTAADRKILTERKCFLAHNCRSNMNNHVGYNARLPEMQRVVLGTDGIGSDMLEEMKFAFFKHRDAGGDLWPADFARFLQNGNEVLTEYFGEPFGRIEKGYKADLVVLDYPQPTPLVKENVAGHMAFGMSSANVDTVIVNGRIVMENRRFAWDTAEAYQAARGAAQKLWHKMDGL